MSALNEQRAGEYHQPDALHAERRPAIEDRNHWSLPSREPMDKHNRYPVVRRDTQIHNVRRPTAIVAPRPNLVLNTLALALVLGVIYAVMTLLGLPA